MSLVLARPLVFFDLETTGADVSSDRIVEFAGLKIQPDQTQSELCFRVNPGMPIPKEATAVHGISDADVAHLPQFGAHLEQLESFFVNCDVAGFNVFRFDLPLLFAEFIRHGSKLDIRQLKVIDVMNIYHKKERRDLSAAYRFYCNADLQNAHSALADITATKEILFAQLQKYPDLPHDAGGLHKFSVGEQNADPFNKVIIDSKGEARIAFGKEKGRTYKQVYREKPDYFQWMLDRVLSEYSKELIRLHWKSESATPDSDEGKEK